LRESGAHSSGRKKVLGSTRAAAAMAYCNAERSAKTE
jgi:hypothetical protein